MPVIEGLDPNLQWLLTTAFVIAVGVFTAWSHVKGRAQPRPKQAEFAMTGELADMGPVRELVEQCGLLVQQMVRANIAQEQTAAALERLAMAYEGQIAAARNEAEIEDEVQKRFEREMERERRARRRATTTRKPAAKD